MTIAASAHLGTYEVVAQIGAGGMGEVYQAHDRHLRVPLLKTYSAGFFLKSGWCGARLVDDPLRSDPRFAELLRRINLQP